VFITIPVVDVIEVKITGSPFLNPCPVALTVSPLSVKVTATLVAGAVLVARSVISRSDLHE
jgi:hypothetical protein